MFADREEAGRSLAAELTKICTDLDMVLGVARGGVPVAKEVANTLNIPLAATAANKIRAPWNPELAMGAVGEDGTHVREEGVLKAGRVSEEEFEQAKNKALEELRRRIDMYGSPGKEVKNQKVVICDDGAATGMTLRASILAQRNIGAAHITVAVPVSSTEAAQLLGEESDELVVLESPCMFMAVGQFYRSFPPVTDEEILNILNEQKDK